MVSNIFDGKKEESLESEKILITRSLLLDFAEKSESSDSSECSSVLTYQAGSDFKEKSATDDDDASLWSIQVNASTHDEDEEEVIEEEEEKEEDEDYYDEEDEEIDGEEDDGSLVDELCEGISKIFVNEKTVPKFAGKHKRFVYNSDDELVAEEEEDFAGVSPSILRLKGLPTPKGKHLRFPLEEE